jgi:hypothetical protein
MKKQAKKYASKLLGSLGFEVRRTRITAAKLSAVYSYNGEQEIASKRLAAIPQVNQFAVDIGASNGVTMSNTFALFLAGWRGLALEFNGDRFASLAGSYKDLPGVTLVRGKVTPLNVMDLLKSADTPKNFGFLSLDIDSYDHFVLEKLLAEYRPSLMCVEINEKIPPPIRFTVTWDPNFAFSSSHLYGQSLSQLAFLAEKMKYDLVELHYNNAFLMPKELNKGRRLTAVEAYREGYLEKSDRKERFPWNADMEPVLGMQPREAMAFIERHFEANKGAYSISL